MKNGMKRFFLTIAFGILASPVVVGNDKQPSVLFIAIDDLNDWIGCLGGHPQALTPNMDRLASQGILFTNAHCAAPACTPSRTSVFTGQMPNNTGVWANKGPRLKNTRPDAHLLPHSFQQAGYRTVGTGKLGPNDKCWKTFHKVEQRWSPLSLEACNYTKRELPTKGTSKPRHVVNYNGRQHILPLNGMPSDRTPTDVKGESFDWGPFDVPDEEFGDTQITNWAIQQLREPSQKPLFMGVGYYRPHQPLWAPARFFKRFQQSPGQLPQVKANDLEDLSDIARNWALLPVTSGTHATVVKFDQWQAAVEAYLACVTYVDHEIGRLIDALDESQYANNVTIVVWSDHGWHLGEKQHWGKWTGWERSTKVPLIIVPPQLKASQFATAGSRCDQPVNLVDLYPTLMELCKLKGPGHALDGRSLVPQLKIPSQQEDRASITMFDPGNVSVRTNRWRYIRYEDNSEELYDLNNDPNEWHNLAMTSLHPSVLRSMRNVAMTHVKAKGTPNRQAFVDN